MIVGIARRCRIVGGKRRGRGLADDGGAGLFQEHHHGRVRARLMAAIDRRAHFGGHISGVDDVLDADRDAAQRAFGLRARIFGAMGEGYFRISAFNSRANAEEVARRIKAIAW